MTHQKSFVRSQCAYGMLNTKPLTDTKERGASCAPFSLSQVEFPLQGLSPLLAKRADKAQGQLAGRAARWAEWVAV